MIGLGLRWNKERNAGDATPKGDEDALKADAATTNAPTDSPIAEPVAESFSAALRAATAARNAAVALQNSPTGSGTATAATDKPGDPPVRPQAQQHEAAGVTSAAATPVVPQSTPAAPSPSQTAPEPRADLAGLSERLQAALGTRFAVQKPIAIGGMATIFLLRHRLHDGLFVAKVLHPELVAKPGVAAGFRAEASHAAQLGNHPNAVPVFDLYESDDLLYLLMPYVEGADLDRILQKAGPLSREETLQLAAQLSSLLCAAESLNIVHGDLTPGNVRLDVFGQYRVLDFGISQGRGPQDRPYSGGTPLYNSPEQLAGEPLDTRSDLYSLGAVLCECLSNTPAFAADTLAAIHARHRAGDWALPTTLHADDPLRRLLTILLSKDPAGRPESAYELSGILHALGWARPEFRPTPQGADPFMRAPGQPPRKRLSD